MRKASPCPVSAIERETLRELDLVAEQGGRLAAPRLPRVERRQHEVCDEERPQRTEARSGRDRLRLRRRSLGRDLDERRLADLGTAAARTGTDTSAAAHAATTVLSRSAGTSGIVTSTSSGRATRDERLRLVEAAEHLHAEDAAAPDAGLSSRKPTTRASAVSRNSRASRLPERPAPTSSDSLARSGGRQPRAGREQRAARAAIRRRASCRGGRRPAKISSGKPASDCVLATIAIVIGSRERRRRRDREQVARRREPPDPAVDPEERRRRRSGRASSTGSVARKTARWTSVPLPSTEEQVRDEERGADDREVDEHLDEPARLRDERPQERRRRPGSARARAFLEVAEEARELDEDDERDEHAHSGHAWVVERVVGECRSGRAAPPAAQAPRLPAARRGRSRRAGATSGRGRPASTGRRSRVLRIVTSVVSRIGMASTRSGSSMPVSVAPAAVQLDASAEDASPNPITWLPESPMKTAAGLPAGG